MIIGCKRIKSGSSQTFSKTKVMKYIIDEQGHKFKNLSRAMSAYQFSIGSFAYNRFRRDGKITVNGITFTLSDEDIPEPQYFGEPEREKKVKEPEKKPEIREVVRIVQDPLLDKLRERYTDEELKRIAKGQGIEKNHIPFPEIHLKGKHHKFVVMSDTHIGSKYSPVEWHDVVAEFVNDKANGVEAILHAGDLVEGFTSRRAGTQVYELTDIGFEAQKEAAIELMSKYNVPIYLISGNHDMYFNEYAGANICKAVAEAVPNIEYIGHDSADIDVDGCKVRLFHGGDGSNSYAVSYRLQKLVESYTGGQKPNILIAGHVHKFCFIFERHIFAISAPCMQSQTSWMRGKKLAAHTGFLVLEFDTYEGGVANLSVQLFPFYA